MPRTTSIRLPDNTVWPDPRIDHRDLDQPQADHHARAQLSAYQHLVTHPAGTESVLRQLRMLRRVIAEGWTATDPTPTPERRPYIIIDDSEGSIAIDATSAEEAWTLYREMSGIEDGELDAGITLRPLTAEDWHDALTRIEDLELAASRRPTDLDPDGNPIPPPADPALLAKANRALAEQVEQLSADQGFHVDAMRGLARFLADIAKIAGLDPNDPTIEPPAVVAAVQRLHDAVRFVDEQGAEAIERVSRGLIADRWNDAAGYQATIKQQASKIVRLRTMGQQESAQLTAAEAERDEARAELASARNEQHAADLGLDAFGFYRAAVAEALSIDPAACAEDVVEAIAALRTRPNIPDGWPEGWKVEPKIDSVRRAGKDQPYGHLRRLEDGTLFIRLFGAVRTAESDAIEDARRCAWALVRP